MSEPLLRAPVPSCPWCGQTDNATRISHPRGDYLCACGSLYFGDSDEWHRLTRVRERRRQATEAQRALAAERLSQTEVGRRILAGEVGGKSVFADDERTSER